MKFDNNKVNLLLDEMENILSNIKNTSKEFQRKLDSYKQLKHITEMEAKGYTSQYCDY